ncbi:MAG: dihydrofolate reductase [Proteobacteria bacterium]|nr:dihydrofolate reductase [Pseudomonadota bacterium]
MTLKLVAARSLNNVIGNDSEIPWKARGEQKLFREITMHGVLIMGRKTFESIGRPLPGRVNVIVTRNTQYHQPGCEIAASLETAIDFASQHDKPVFVIGGGEIYGQALPIATGVHLTTIQCEVEGNIFFPPFPTDDFTLMEEKYYRSNIDYLYQYYERR